MSAFAKAVQLVGGPSVMAGKLGVSVQAVCFWRDGKRKLPVERCYAIEQATDGQVRRQDLRPDDWQLIWPELSPNKVA